MVGHSQQQLRVGSQVNEAVLGIPAQAQQGERGRVSGLAGCRRRHAARRRRRQRRQPAGSIAVGAYMPAVFSYVWGK